MFFLTINIKIIAIENFDPRNNINNKLNVFISFCKFKLIENSAGLIPWPGSILFFFLLPCRQVCVWIERNTFNAKKTHNRWTALIAFDFYSFALKFPLRFSVLNDVHALSLLKTVGCAMSSRTKTITVLIKYFHRQRFVSFVPPLNYNWNLSNCFARPKCVFRAKRLSYYGHSYEAELRAVLKLLILTWN